MQLQSHHDGFVFVDEKNMLLFFKISLEKTNLSKKTKNMKSSVLKEQTLTLPKSAKNARHDVFSFFFINKIVVIKLEKDKKKTLPFLCYFSKS